jgi:hypothetical protein
MCYRCSSSWIFPAIRSERKVTRVLIMTSRIPLTIERFKLLIIDEKSQHTENSQHQRHTSPATIVLGQYHMRNHVPSRLSNAKSLSIYTTRTPKPFFPLTRHTPPIRTTIPRSHTARIETSPALTAFSPPENSLHKARLTSLHRTLTSTLEYEVTS